MKPRYLLCVVFLVLLLTSCRPSGVETIPTIEEDESAAAALAGGSLASLSSYRFTLEMTTSREIDGRMVEEIETIIQEATRSPEETLHIKHIRQNEEIGIIPLSSDRYRQGLLAFESEQRPEGDVCHILILSNRRWLKTGRLTRRLFLRTRNAKGRTTADGW